MKNNLSSTKRYSYREFVKVLKKNGYIFHKSGKGSHMLFKNEEGRTISVPRCNSTINKNLVHEIVRKFGLKL